MKKTFNLGRTALAAGLLASSLAVVAPSANAAAVVCPNATPSSSVRVFTLTTAPTASCLAFGENNLNGNGDAVNLLGYITLDKTDDTTTGLFPNAVTITGGGSTGGTFSFTAPAGYKDFVLGVKSGNGNDIANDWAAFLLPAGVTSGSWSISGRQGLSHISLYGKAAPVPVPAAVWLLGSALAGVTVTKRRKDA